MRLTFRKKRIQLFFALTGLLALWLSGLFWFVRTTNAMQPPEAQAALDAVVVLTGGSNRLETGFDLLDRGLGEKLFISGVHRGVEARELMKISRRESEAHLDCCVALGGAENTVENARETAAWLRERGYRRFYLVTANYHMHRALLEFHAVAPELSPTPWPVAPARLDMQNWWRDAPYRMLIIREYTKYLLARLLHIVRT